MRPIKLTMAAFGPYAGETTIDFRELGPRTLLLIHGPTGSGKTTILDAVCFALFGETSGGDREAGQMRSQLAGGKDLLAVQYDFALGGDTFRVFRRPAQTVEGRKTATKPEAVLWRRTGLINDATEGSVEASGWRDVTEAVIRKIGFDEKQFRQVIMLPQGQFRKLLSSDSRERQDILERLFQTEIYRRIEEALKETRNSLKRESDELKAKKDLILGQAGVDSGDALENKKRSNLDELARIRTELDALLQGEQAARTALEAARRDELKLKEKAEAERAAKSLEAQQPEIETKRRVLDRGRAAAGVKPVEHLAKARLADWQAAQGKIKEQERLLFEAKGRLDAAGKNLDIAESRKPERDLLGERLAVLKGIEPKMAEVDELRKKMARYEIAAQERRETCQKLQDEAGSLTSKTEAAKRKFQEIEKMAIRLDELKLVLDKVNRHLTWRRELDQKKGEFAAAQRNLADDVARCADGEKLVSIARNHLESLESDWKNGQAARLAKSLETGKPCPVCGSTSHPAPAASEVEIPGDELIQQQKETVLHFEKQLNKLKDQKSRQETRTGRLESELEQLSKNLAEDAARSADDLKQEFTRYETELKKAGKAEKELAIIKSEIEVLEKIIAENKKQSQAAEIAKNEVEHALTGIKAQLGARQADVPGEFGTLNDLLKTISAVGKRIGDLDAALKKARDDHSQAGQVLAATQASLTAAEMAAHQAEAAHANQRAEFEQAITANGFIGENEYRAAILGEADLRLLEKRINEFAEQLAGARDRLARAEDAAQGLAAPDLPALEQAARGASEALAEANTRQGGLQAQRKQIERWLSDLGDTDKQLAHKQERFAVVGRLAEAAGGDNPLRMSFHRFVLAALLDEVLAAASQRLRIMSHGRYQLYRSVDTADLRRAGGLELEVFDEYTGKARPVATLSGGEGFLASLSLALGLADAVQAQAGGIHLETIFIDEGFGSLDAEALDLAVRALIDLQKGGRLVGLISHVPELKERIDTRLEITTSRSGSQARFVLGG